MRDGREAVVVIGGGVGPMAGVAMHARLIEETLAGDDQSHLTVLHFSRSAAIPDRTKYLLSSQGGGADIANPALSMAEVFMGAARALEAGESAVGGVPCNTFHAPLIFERFLAELAGRGNPIRVLNMLEEAVGLLAARLGGARGERIGVLSTTGTRLSKVYDGLLAGAGYRAEYVDEADQPRLHDAIYHPEWGIKATNPPSRRAVETVAEMAGQLGRRGVAAVIPACTELPLVLSGIAFEGVPLVDPLVALARGVIREAAPSKLRPLRNVG